MRLDASHSDLDRLFAKLLEEGLDASERRLLNDAMRQDASLRELYRKYMMVDAMLRWDLSPPLMELTGEREDSGISGQWPEAEIHPSSFIPHPSSLIPHPSPIPPIVIDPTPSLHSPFGSFVFSHVAAAVILGVGLLIGLAWRISLPSTEGPGATGYASVMVGRITALADCQWHKEGSGFRVQGSGIPKTKDQRPKTVYLGDRFHVASGLMQITYDTGAKVILQGPCTYEIDSDRGGYLAVGKLTAKVDKKAEGGERRADRYPLSTTHYPLFAVRTPTAVVTDLGTEFGVEVEENGATRSHVFQGSVSIIPSPNGRGVGGEGKKSRRLATSGKSAEILHAGQSAHVERGRDSTMVIRREPGQPKCFVRAIPKAPNHQISKSSPSSFAYRLIDLGTLGGPMSRAIAINATGMVVGRASDRSGAVQAFLYAKGKTKRLGIVHANHSCALSINSLGHVVGSLRTIGGRHAFFHSNAGTVVGAPGTGAYDINDDGIAAGVAVNAQGVERACVWRNSKAVKDDLGTLGGPKAKSSACSINNNGLVVGLSETIDGSPHAFIYSDGDGMKDLGTRGGRYSVAYHVNASGQIVGQSALRSGDKHAFVYDSRMGMKELGALGGSNSLAGDMNCHGQIVGYAEGVDHSRHAFLYSGGNMIDLNSLIDQGAGWCLTHASGINDSGQIVGWGTAPNGRERAFLLTPIKTQGARD